MSSSAIRPVSATTLVGIYSAVFALITAVYLILDYFFELNLASVGIIIAAIASMSLARNWIMREKIAPNSKRVWKISFACAVVTLIFFIVIGGLGIMADEKLMNEILNQTPLMLLVVFIILFVFSFVVIRISLWFGIKQALRQVRLAQLKQK
ncbi:ABZJ_00895 family protein [Brucellaceae bacterium C25G]